MPISGQLSVRVATSATEFATSVFPALAAMTCGDAPHDLPTDALRSFHETEPVLRDLFSCGVYCTWTSTFPSRQRQ
ncbi:hypothetical protein MTO96_008556 [Rhipicephalus appendiculatus]